MAPIILDEILGRLPELIEQQLAHAMRGPLGRAYRNGRDVVDSPSHKGRAVQEVQRPKQLTPRFVRWTVWALFVWGVLMCAIMLVSGPFSGLDMSSFRAVYLGVGLFFGWPSWIGLPLVLTFFGRGFRRGQVALFLAPVVVAALFWWIHPINQLRGQM